MLTTACAATPIKVADGVHMVGGADLTDPRDCLCYLVEGDQARVLIDAGAGPSAGRILDMVQKVCTARPTHLLLTHAHIDHAGGAAEIKRRCGCEVLIHPDDAETLIAGDAVRSAANWYGLELEPLQPDVLVEDGHALALEPGRDLKLVHTPGHTPGSLAAWCQAGEFKVLFGQDVHGPFSPAFGSDIKAWRQSMQGLLELEADILAEGHYGVFRPAQEVEAFISGQLSQH